MSLEGSVIITRNDANEKLYGQRYTAKELLNGTVAPPVEADSLYRALNAKFHNLGSMGAMHQRRLEQEESRGISPKKTTISARGTLKIPGLRQQNTGGYGAPNIPPPQPYQANNNVHHPPNTYGDYGQKHQLPNTEQYPPMSVYQEPTTPLPRASQLPSSPPPLFDGQQLNFVREIKSENKNTTMPIPPPRVPAQHSKPTRARALYPFEGQEEGDLTFREGDVIIVTEKTNSTEDWWSGTLNGKTGAVSLFFF